MTGWCRTAPWKNCSAAHPCLSLPWVRVLPIFPLITGNASHMGKNRSHVPDVSGCVATTAAASPHPQTSSYDMTMKISCPPHRRADILARYAAGDVARVRLECGISPGLINKLYMQISHTQKSTPYPFYKKGYVIYMCVPNVYAML